MSIGCKGIAFMVRFYRILQVGAAAIMISMVLRGKRPEPLEVVNKAEDLPRVPPWPIYRVAVAVNRMLNAAAEKSAPPHQRLLALSMSYTQSAITYGIAQHKIVDAIPRQTGATCKDVADFRGLSLDFTCRFMRAAGTLGLLAEHNEVFWTTSVGDLLRHDEPQSLRHSVLYLNSQEKVAAMYAAAEKSMLSGKSGFMEAYDTELFDWLSKDTERTQEFQYVFDQAMSASNYLATSSILADLQGLDTAETVCDIGGGRGNFLASIARLYPQIPNLVLFDLPQSVAHALPELIHSNRTKIYAGSFFDPKALREAALYNCTIITLKHVLHNWSDDDATTIIKNIAQAAIPPPDHFKKSTPVLVIAEFIQSQAVSQAPIDRAVASLDIQMLASLPSGARERSFQDFLRMIPFPRNSVSFIPLRGPYAIIQFPLLRAP